MVESPSQKSRFQGARLRSSYEAAKSRSARYDGTKGMQTLMAMEESMSAKAVVEYVLTG